MSEYQYYEFQAVDRPLSNKQMEELSRYSSRAQITPTSFVNVYNYGDFRGDPDKLVGKYFDAFLYLANWGTRWLMLRVPNRLLDPAIPTPYRSGDCLSSRQRGDDLVLSFRSEDEENYGWVEGEGWLASLLPIRAALMRGDHRALYLGWLLGAQTREVDDDAVEPAVPPGLGGLDGPLARLAEFLRIDEDLIAAAAEGSTTALERSPSKLEIVSWISKLADEERDRQLVDLIADNDPYLVVDLQQCYFYGHSGLSRSSSRHERRNLAHTLGVPLTSRRRALQSCQEMGRIAVREASTRQHPVSLAHLDYLRADLYAIAKLA